MIVDTTKDIYRFRPTIGWFTHLWKSATRQDHKALRPTLGKLLPKDGVAIDVGAHGGQVTRLLAGLMPRGMVVAVEPSGYARSLLRPVLWSRGVRNAIIVAAALGARDGVATLRTPIKDKGDIGYGLAHVGTGRNNGSRRMLSETVLVTTLDSLVAELDLNRVDFIKVDIEGYEADFVSGAHGTLARFKPILMMEHDDGHLARAGSSAASLWSQMNELGYEAHSRSGGGLVKTGPASQDSDVFWIPLRADAGRVQ
jgi:FkbM family methyltransferase